METALHCGATAAAGRILRAVRQGDAGALASALDAAARAGDRGRGGSDAEERAELLDAVVDVMRPRGRRMAEASARSAGMVLLSHLSGESARIHRAW